MDSISPSSIRSQVMATPNFGGEQAASVAASVEQWALEDHQHQECLKTSPHPILPAIGLRHPPKFNHHSHRRSFRCAIDLALLYLRESINANGNAHRWLSTWLRKSMGLHLNLHRSGDEDWECAQAITRFCVHNVSLPGADHHRCSRHQQGTSYARFGPV